MRGRQTRTKGRSCFGKKAHDSWDQVNAHIERLVARGAYRPSLVGYPCKKCGAKHVGHRMPSGRDRRDWGQ